MKELKLMLDQKNQDIKNLESTLDKAKDKFEEKANSFEKILISKEEIINQCLKIFNKVI